MIIPTGGTSNLWFHDFVTFCMLNEIYITFWKWLCNCILSICYNFVSYQCKIDHWVADWFTYILTFKQFWLSIFYNPNWFCKIVQSTANKIHHTSCYFLFHYYYSWFPLNKLVIMFCQYFSISHGLKIYKCCYGNEVYLS